MMMMMMMMMITHSCSLLHVCCCFICTSILYFVWVEICLLTNAKRVASVRAETYCNLFSLSVEHFTAVLTRYPSMKKAMQTVAAQRLHNIGQDPTVVYRQPSTSSLFQLDNTQTTGKVDT